MPRLSALCQIALALVVAPLEKAGETEGATITAAMRTHDGREGIAAFAQRRTPVFIGR